MNEYLTAMTMFFMNKMEPWIGIGDAIVAMFGAPVPFSDHAYLAVKTSLLIQKRQEELRKKWKTDGDKWLNVYPNTNTCGCNTGEAIVGNMGPIHRFEFSMMGPNINLAARCESMARIMCLLMITEYTQSAAVNQRTISFTATSARP